ncbi:MAG: VWA domain-containing protein [Acidobacteriota bacterium]|nr:VWA domain-containing protein [Acidobacteriota bacterium]
MISRLALAAALSAAAVAGFSASPAGQQTFRGGVDVVSLAVTVMDKDARYISGLDRADFQVFEDGVLQDITYFSRQHQPIALTLLIDTSTSMEAKMRIAQEAAIGFARQLTPADVAAVVEFDSRPQILQTFTSDKSLLEAAIRKTAAGGSTSLYNAIYIGLRELQRVKAASIDDVRRQAIVVLSDGEDTTSLLSYEEVLELAKRSETAVYAIGLRSRDEASASGFREAEFVLRSLAQQTGGREFFVDDAKELPAIYQRIADELANQYSMGYSSKNGRRDGAWRRIVVRIDRPSATARTKQGYYGPGGSK